MKQKITILASLILAVSISFFSSCCANSNELGSVASPDKNFEIEVFKGEQGELLYQVQWCDKAVIMPSALGLTMASGETLAQSADLISVEQSSSNETWTPVYGESNSYVDNYNEVLLTFGKDQSKVWGLRMRAYNEGVALKYEFYTGGDVDIISEQTEFAIDATASAWTSTKSQDPIRKSAVADLVGVQHLERPILIECSDDCYVALGEAKLVDFARMRLYGDRVEGEAMVIKNKLNEPTDSDIPARLTKDNNSTPWRYVMAAASPSAILQNNFLLLNLNDKCQIEDTSWIKPGKVLREVTLTTQGAKACIDFSKRNNVEYIMFDAGWYGPENSMESDATTVTLDPARSTGPFNMDEILSYAKKNDVGVVLYVNRRAMEQKEEEIFKLFKKWGIAGIKYGFVNVGSQEWTHWLHRSIAEASKYNLMIDVHDEYRPTGWSRTYPNFLTQEGIRGDEESTPNDLAINTIFTRMIAGAGDQTNCYYASRVEELMGSRASQMAKMVCIYSPFQSIYWYDRPVGSPSKTGGAGGAETFIKENDETKFYAQVPTVWDETLVVEGYPGEFARIARRSGDDWYMGALTGKKAHNFDVKFDFLKAGQSYEATIYSDVIVNGEKQVKMTTERVNSTTRMSKVVEAMNGFAMIIKPVK